MCKVFFAEVSTYTVSMGADRSKLWYRLDTHITSCDILWTIEMDFAWVVTTGLVINYEVKAPLDTVEAVQILCCMLRRECQTMEELGVLEFSRKWTLH